MALQSAVEVVPFTLEHFREWTRELILDNGEEWELEPFQEAFVEDVFRGTPECWLVVPEGNGKTTLVAGIALYYLDHQMQAAIPVAASSREQAEIIYRQAEGFVVRSPMLHEQLPDELRIIKGKRAKDVPRFECLDGFRRIKHYKGGRIQVFAADDRTGDGIIPTLCLIDELHRHRDLKLYRTWRGKLEKRNGQILTISTAGEPGSEFEETREKIRQLADEITREETFVRAASEELVLHEWAVPEGGDVEDFELVKRANPFTGISVEGLSKKFSSPTMTFAHWRRFVCNLPTRSEFAAIQEDEWLRAKVDEGIPTGQPIALGVDVGFKYDTTALQPFWQREHAFRLLDAPTILTPPRDGSMIEPYVIENAVLEIHRRNPVHTVVMDTSRAENLAQWIGRELNATVIDRTQGNTLVCEDYERFMEALREGWLKHTGDPGLTRHALNAVARLLPDGRTRFDRPHQTRHGGQQDMRVIDALVAAAMVHNEVAGGAGGGLVY